MTMLEVNASSALFFIDDTGHEELSKAKHPAFGLGGCAILSGHYYNDIVVPWREMKAEHFGGPDVLLHASKTRHNPQQKEALGDFFRKANFYRFAVMLSTETRIDSRHNAYEAACKSMEPTLHMILRDMDANTPPRFQHNSLTVVAEASQRADHLADRHLFFVDLYIDGIKVPVTRAKADKKLREPGLEVADYIMHTAGRHYRRKKPEDTILPKDFSAVFLEVPKGLSYYRELAAFGPPQDELGR